MVLLRATYFFPVAVMCGVLHAKTFISLYLKIPQDLCCWSYSMMELKLICIGLCDCFAFRHILYPDLLSIVPHLLSAIQTMMTGKSITCEWGRPACSFQIVWFSTVKYSQCNPNPSSNTPHAFWCESTNVGQHRIGIQSGRAIGLYASPASSLFGADLLYGTFATLGTGTGTTTPVQMLVLIELSFGNVVASFNLNLLFLYFYTIFSHNFWKPSWVIRTK